MPNCTCRGYGKQNFVWLHKFSRSTGLRIGSLLFPLAVRFDPGLSLSCGSQRNGLLMALWMVYTAGLSVLWVGPFLWTGQQGVYCRAAPNRKYLVSPRVHGKQSVKLFKEPFCRWPGIGLWVACSLPVSSTSWQSAGTEATACTLPTNSRWPEKFSLREALSNGGKKCILGLADGG